MFLETEPIWQEATLAISASLAKERLLTKLLLRKDLCSPWSSPAPKLCLGPCLGEWHLSWSQRGPETTLTAWEQFWALFPVLTLLSLNLFDVCPKTGAIVLQSLQGQSCSVPAGKMSWHLGLPRFTLFKWKTTQYLRSFQSFLWTLN